MYGCVSVRVYEYECVWACVHGRMAEGRSAEWKGEGMLRPGNRENRKKASMAAFIILFQNGNF